MKAIYTIVISLLLVISAGVTSTWIFGSDMPLSIVVAATAIISFFGLYKLNLPAEPTALDREASLRFAIAGAIVLEYLVLVGIVAFFKKGPNQLPPITNTLITNFTTIVGVVIAFYFGSSAYVQGKQISAKKSEDHAAVDRNSR